MTLHDLFDGNTSDESIAQAIADCAVAMLASKLRDDIDLQKGRVCPFSYIEPMGNVHEAETEIPVHPVESLFSRIDGATERIASQINVDAKPGRFVGVPAALPNEAPLMARAQKDALILRMVVLNINGCETMNLSVFYEFEEEPTL